MDPERWKTIESLYHAALALEPGRRSAFLDSACVGDTALRQRIAALARGRAGHAEIRQDIQDVPGRMRNGWTGNGARLLLALAIRLFPLADAGPSD